MKKPYQLAVDGITDGLNWFFTRAFSKVHVERNSYAPEMFKDSMVMVVSTHRSQSDYFLIGWVLYENSLPYLRIAAGDNLLGFPFIGKKFSAFGAFPVQRDMAFRKAYVRQLCLDVVNMMEAGEPILVFPEGGRSYRGNMMEMKGGILMSAILAQSRNPGKKVFLVPSAVSYEFLPELPYFEMLHKGKNMRKKSNNAVVRLFGNLYYFGADIMAFASFILGTRLGIKHGEVFVNLGKPICLRDIVDISANFNSEARDEMSGHQTSMRAMCDHLYEALHSLYHLFPEHVVAAVLKEHPSIDMQAAVEPVRTLCELLVSQKRNCDSFSGLSPQQIIAKGTAQLRHVNAVAVRGNTISIRKQSIVDYYAAALSE